jgi:hypothetical protein
MRKVKRIPQTDDEEQEIFIIHWKRKQNIKKYLFNKRKTLWSLLNWWLF